MDFVPIREGVRKRIIKEGKGDIPEFPADTKVTFHFKTYIVDGSKLSKSSFDDSKRDGRAMELIFGKQFKMPVWEECIKTMKVDEISEFEVKHNLVDAYPLVAKYYREFADAKKKFKAAHTCGMMAFTEGVGHKDLDLLLRNPSDLLFELEIVTVKQPGEYNKELWSMNNEEKLKTIPTLKEKGNDLYRKQQYEDAALTYAQALGLLEQLILREKPGDQEWKALEDMKIPLLSNFAQCKLSLGEYYPVIDCTTKILARDGKNVKALYKRGKAYAGTWDLELARMDFEKVAEFDPSLQEEVNKWLVRLKSHQRSKDDEIRGKLFGKIFENFEPGKK